MRKRALRLGLSVFIPCLWAFCPLSLSAQQAPSDSYQRQDREKQFAKYVEIPGAERLGSDQCRACHEEPAKTFRRSNHSLQGLDCEDCHGSGSQHITSDRHGNIIKFREVKAEQANGVCLWCHAGHEQLQNWSSGAHQAHDVRCIDCHQVHTAEPKLGSRRQRIDACVACHRKQEAESRLPYHHPVREAKMGCADCHDPHGGTASNNLRNSNLNELCFQCHAEFQGPFTYQHAPVVESCTKCHTPHGSMQRSLLLVSQPTLCLQCHAGHHNGSAVPLLNSCTNCHSSIHGSDVPSATGGSLFMDKSFLNPK
jgi:DmsE family decaheme c-type cytochrome